VECIQYIVVRKDLVPTMGVGKTAAQVAHASMAAVCGRDDILTMRGFSSIIIDNPNVIEWFQGPFGKLVVYVKTRQKLLNLAQKLDEQGIHHKMIWDACRTSLEPEEKDGTTLTCMGVEPMRRDKVPKCLAKLQLLD